MMKHFNTFRKYSAVCLAAALLMFAACQKDSEISSATFDENAVYPTAARVWCSFTFEVENDYEDGGLLYGTDLSQIEEGHGQFSSLDVPSDSRLTPEDITCLKLTGLSPNTTYYYRPTLTKNGSVMYGSIGTFTTPSALSLSCEVVKEELAAFSASVKVTYNTSGLSYTVMDVGVQYALSSADIASGKKMCANTSGTSVLTGLSSQTTYQYRPFAYVYYPSLDVYDFIYGPSTATFQTPEATKPTAEVAVSYNGGTFTITTPDVSDSRIKECGIQYAETSNGVASASLSAGTQLTSTSFQYVVTDCSSETTYYYRPYYYCRNGEYVYGEIKSFTTAKAPTRSLTLSSTSKYPWATYTGLGSNGLRSTNYHVNSSTSASTLTIYVDGRTTFKFYYKVSSENRFDKLTIVLDGTTVANDISGTSSSYYSKALTAGTHTLTMSYAKDASTYNNDDRGYIYDMSFDGVLISNSDIN